MALKGDDLDFHDDERDNAKALSGGRRLKLSSPGRGSVTSSSTVGSVGSPARKTILDSVNSSPSTDSHAKDSIGSSPRSSKSKATTHSGTSSLKSGSSLGSLSTAITASQVSEGRNSSKFKSVGRTKSQRLKLLKNIGEGKEDVNSSQSTSFMSLSQNPGLSFSQEDSLISPERQRKVRFSIGEDEASSEEIDQQSRSHSTSKSASTSTKNSFHVWSSSPSRSIKSARQKIENENQLERTKKNVKRPIRGSSSAEIFKAVGGSDRFTMQNSTNQEMIHDDFMFLCSTVVDSKLPVSSSTLKAAITAISDLAKIVSLKVNRKNLFYRPGCGKNTNGSSSPLSAAIGVISWVQEFAISTSSGTQADDGTLEGDSDISHPQPSSNKRHACRKRKLLNGSTSDSEDTPTTSKAVCANAAEHVNNKRLLKQQRQLLDSIALVLHYISLDCTLAKAAASVGGKGARKIRRTILTDSMCLQGILHLVLSDPLTRQHCGDLIPGVLNVESEYDGDRHSTVSSVLSSPQSVARTVDSASLISSPDSQSTGASSLDPTIAGRRRRRKKQRVEGKDRHIECGTLETIKESAYNIQVESDLDFCEEPKENVQEKLSFNSDSTKASKTKKKVHSMRKRDEEELDSLSSCSSSQARDQIDVITTKVLDDIKRTTVNVSHSCGKFDSTSLAIASSLPLLSFNRIVSGKFEGGANEKSCIDEENIDDEELAEYGDEDPNPLLLTNRFLGESGSIPLLSQALSESLAAAVHLLRERNCDGCLAILHDRISILSSLVDGASLLNDYNRMLFCEQGYTKQFGGCLVIGLVSFLRGVLLSDVPPFDGKWGDIMLATLRTLTSLTHENQMAADELEGTLPDLAMLDAKKGKEDRSYFVSGLDVVIEVLHTAVDECGRKSAETHKLKYDSIVFCLNTLANVVESNGNFQVMTEMSIRRLKCSKSENTLVLPWLTRWLVSETESFRELVVDSDTESTECCQPKKQLDAKDSEHLVTAGNGLVLLSCIMIRDKENEMKSRGVIKRKGDNRCPGAALDQILEELPGDDNSSKINFIKNTLVAFCNFYHYSVGDLSVAVVAPVKSLIGRLDEMQMRWRQNSLSGANNDETAKIS